MARFFGLTLAAFLTFVALGTARADTTGVTLPSASPRVSGFDGFIFPNGIKCRQAIGAPGPYLDLGFATEYRTADRPQQLAGGGDGRSKLGVVGYMRFVIPFSKPPPRINCAKLFAIGLAYLQYRLTKPVDWVDPRRDPEPQYAKGEADTFVLRKLLRRIPAQRSGALRARPTFTVEVDDPDRARTGTSPKATH